MRLAILSHSMLSNKGRLALPVNKLAHACQHRGYSRPEWMLKLGNDDVDMHSVLPVTA